jgi:hypothetical protein
MAEIRDLLDRLLAECLALDASDVHLASGLSPYFRVYGVLDPKPDYGKLDPATMTGLAAELSRGLSLEPTGSLDGAFTAATGHRYRFNIFRRQGTLAIALRRLEDRFRSLADLGLPESAPRPRRCRSAEPTGLRGAPPCDTGRTPMRRLFLFSIKLVAGAGLAVAQRVTASFCCRTRLLRQSLDRFPDRSPCREFRQPLCLGCLVRS